MKKALEVYIDNDSELGNTVLFVTQWLSDGTPRTHEMRGPFHGGAYKIICPSNGDGVIEEV